MRVSSQRVRPIDVKHLGHEHVICCWEVDGVLVDPGPAVVRGDAARGDRRRAPARAAADPHPLRPRRRRGRARAPLARPAGLRPRARRQAPRRPGAARRQRGAALRRRGGPGAAVGRGRPGPGGEPARARGRRDGRRGRLPRRVHARPRLPPRLLPPRAQSGTAFVGDMAGVVVPPEPVHARPDAAARHRRRGVGALARRSIAGLGAAGARADALRRASRTRRSSSSASARRLHEQARLAGEHDEEGFVEAYTRYVHEQAGDAADAILQAAPLDQL